MAVSAGEIEATLRLRDDFSTAMRAYLSATKDIATETEAAAAATSGWGAILHDLGSSFVLRVTEGVLLRDAVRELISAVKDGIEAFPRLLETSAAVGNSLYEMALKTGSSVEGLSELRYVASQTGVNFESFSTVLGMMEKNLGAIGPTAAKVQEAVGRLGLDFETLKNERPDEAFKQIAAALADIPNNADKANIAQVLLGRGAKEMAALWHESITPMIEEAHALGLVVSTDMAAAAHVAEVEYNQLQMQLESLGLHISSAFMPAIIGIEHDLGEGLHDAVVLLNGSLSALGGQGGWLGTVSRAMGVGSDAAAAQVQIYNYLKETLIGLVRNSLEPLLSSIGFVMTEFNAAKVVFGDVMQVVDGVALAFEYAAKGVAMLLNVASFGHFSEDVKRIDGNIQGLLETISKRGAALQKDAQAEKDWAQWSIDANKAVEVALNAVGAKHTDVGAIIKHFADVSRAAYGGVSTDVTALTAAQKAFAKAIEDLDSVGADWKATLDGIDGAVVEGIRYYLAAGVAQNVLATAYGLTVAQVKAVETGLKEEVAALKIVEAQQVELEKATDAYYKAVNAASHDTLKAQVDDAYLAADAKIAAMTKSKSYSIAAEMEVWATADQVANNIIQKHLELDKTSHAYYVKLADDARIAYQRSLQFAGEYTDKRKLQLQQEAEAAALTLTDWQKAADAALTGTASSAGIATTAIKQMHDAMFSLQGGGTQVSQWQQHVHNEDLARTMARAGIMVSNVSNVQGTPMAGFAEGGPVTKDGPIFAHAGEYVIPAGGAGGGAGVNVTNNFYVNGTIQDLVQPLMAELTRSIKQARLLPAN